jgi:carbamoyltransferase
MFDYYEVKKLPDDLTIMDIKHLEFSNNTMYHSDFFTKYLGEDCDNFKLNAGYDAGKLMGMSSYGEIIDKNSWIDSIDNFPYINYECINSIKNKKYLLFKEQANLAKKAQYETKEYTIKLIKKSIQLTKSNNIVLSGGYFMNCVNNYEYLKAFPNINFYVDPICYDGGTAIGVSYFTHNILNAPFDIQPINTLYLGG